VRCGEHTRTAACLTGSSVDGRVPARRETATATDPVFSSAAASSTMTQQLQRNRQRQQGESSASDHAHKSR
jgi:hypothetical protein